MSRTYGKQLAAGITATLILMTVVGWLSLDNITSVIRINRTPLHTVETLASLEDALLALRRNPPAGIAKIDAASDEIRRIAAREAAAPPPERLREERRKIILTQLDALKRAVERQSGPAGADIAALTAEIHFSIQEMEREELSALARQSQASARAAYRGIAMLMAGSVFSLGLFLTMAWLVRCGFAERRRSAWLLKRNAHKCKALVNRRTRALAVPNNALKEEILERKRAEEKLREQATLLDLVPDAIAAHSLDGKILYWNQAAERMYGWSANEAKEQDAFGAMYRRAGEEFARARRELFQSGRWSGELRQTTRDERDLTAAVRWVLVYDPAGRPQSALSISADITDRKRLEARLLRAQRLGSVGALAGGIAHDLSNILSPITLASQMLQMKLADPELQRWLQVMECSAQRGADMLKRILAFARGGDGERHLFQPKHLVNEILRMLRDLMPKSIELRLTTRTDPWMINGDATQIHQVLMNLCINARDAMPGENGATVIESLRRINPQARIVAGGAGESVADSTESPERTCLAKPYRLDELLEKLSAVLHSAPSAS